jgi:hypothetical protein
MSQTGGLARGGRDRPRGRSLRQPGGICSDRPNAMALASSTRKVELTRMALYCCQ